MKNKFCLVLVMCMLLSLAGCQKFLPVSEQLVSVFEDYSFSSTVSTANLDSSGYYSTQIPSNVMDQPSSAVADYIGASKRIPNTAVINIVYAEYKNEQDAKNVFEVQKGKIEKALFQFPDSGTEYCTDNFVIGFCVPTGDTDGLCLYYLLYRSSTTIVYINEQGPISFVEENQPLVTDACKTVGFDPTENYNQLLADVKKAF